MFSVMSAKTAIIYVYCLYGAHYTAQFGFTAVGLCFDVSVRS